MYPLLWAGRQRRKEAARPGEWRIPKNLELARPPDLHPVPREQDGRTDGDHDDVHDEHPGDAEPARHGHRDQQEGEQRDKGVHVVQAHFSGRGRLEIAVHDAQQRQPAGRRPGNQPKHDQ